MHRLVSLLILGNLALLQLAAQASDFGDCTDVVESRWLPDGRTMELLSDYQYVDSRMKTWLAEAGKKVDGASIPSPLWSFIGSPLVGLYRHASVPHDVECKAERESWRAVHSMFFEAMRCSGVGEVKARIMYAAVYYCGPRWGDNQGVRLIPCADEPFKAYLRRFKIFFNDHKTMTLTEIAKLELENLEGIDGTSPLERLRRQGFKFVGEEDLEGFTVFLADIDKPTTETLHERARILAAIAEEAKANSDSVVVLQEISNENVFADLEQGDVRNRLAELELAKERLRLVSYDELRQGSAESGEMGSPAIAEEAKANSDSVVVLQEISNENVSADLELVYAAKRVGDVRNRLAELGLAKERLRLVSYDELRQGSAESGEIGSPIQQGVAIRVIQIQDIE